MAKTFSPLTYRRDRAVIEFKEHVLNGPLIDAVNAAVRSATRVRISDALIEAHQAARSTLNSEQMHGRPPKSEHEKTTAGLKAAFEAAGFEVVD